ISILGISGNSAQSCNRNTAGMPSKPKDKVGKTKKPGGVRLAEDQIWQVNGAYTVIVTVGKRLVHYKVANSLRGRAANAVPMRIGTHDAVQEYLRANKGVLVKSPD